MSVGLILPTLPKNHSSSARRRFSGYFWSLRHLLHAAEDLLESLSPSNCHICVITWADHFTCRTKAIIVPCLVPKDARWAFLASRLTEFGCLPLTTMNRGPHFEAAFLNLLQTLGCRHSNTTTYQTYSGGLIKGIRRQAIASPWVGANAFLSNILRPTPLNILIYFKERSVNQTERACEWFYPCPFWRAVGTMEAHEIPLRWLRILPGIAHANALFQSLALPTTFVVFPSHFEHLDSRCGNYWQRLIPVATITPSGGSRDKTWS